MYLSDGEQEGQNKHTDNSKRFNIEVTSLGLLKNNQEPESDEDIPSARKILPEAMLIAAANINNPLDPTSREQSEPSRDTPYLLVSEVPADKNKTRPGTKLVKSDDEKTKPKQVSYSTQLSFESEDEFYDPLFSSSMSHHEVFQKLSSPTKDAFSKSGGDKTDGSTKDAKMVQCLNVGKFVKSDGFVVTQVIPYDDGAHVIVALAKRKQSGNELGSTALRCSEMGGSDACGVAVEASQSNDDKQEVKKGSGCLCTEPENSSCNERKMDNDIEGVGCHYGNSNEKENSDGSSSKGCCLPEEVFSGEKSCGDAEISADRRECHSPIETENSTRASATTVETEPSCGSQVLGSSDPSDNLKRVPLEVINPIENQGTSCSNTEKDDDKDHSCLLLLYKTKKTKGRTLLEDEPCRTMVCENAADSLKDIFLLPEDAEESFNPGAIEADTPKSLYLAGVTSEGSILVRDGLSLEVLTRFPSDSGEPGGGCRHVVFCSGLGSFCACTEGGKLRFLHLVKNTSDSEGPSSVAKTPGNEKQPMGKSVKTLLLFPPPFFIFTANLTPPPPPPHSKVDSCGKGVKVGFHSG